MKQHLLGILLLSCICVISLSSCSKTATDAVQQQTDTLPPFKHLTMSIANIPVQLFDTSTYFANGNLSKTNSRFYDSSISDQNLSLFSNTKKFTFRSHDTISFFFDSSYSYVVDGFDSSTRKIISVLIILDTTKHLIKSLEFNDSTQRLYDGHRSHYQHGTTVGISFTLVNVPYDELTMKSFECNISNSLLPTYLKSFNFYNYYYDYVGHGSVGTGFEIDTKTISFGSSFTGSSVAIKLSL